MSSDWKSRAIDPNYDVRKDQSAKITSNDWQSRASIIENSPDEEDAPESNRDEVLSSHVKDYGKQFAKETVSSALGTYGDLFEAAFGEQDRGKKRTEKDYEILNRMQEPGYKANFEDLYDLGSDTIAPEDFTIPTSKDVSKTIETFGGPEEPETISGRYGKRQGQLYGSGLAFGQTNPFPSLAAGGVGQTANELGAGGLLQGGLEIATLLFTGGRGGAKVSSQKKAVQKEIEALRDLGYSEQDITLAVNSGKKRLSKLASKGKATEKAFEDFSNNSDKIVDNILHSSVEGLEEGTKKVHQMASDAYEVMLKDAAKITIKDSQPFQVATKKVVDHLNNTLKTKPEAAAFIETLESAALAATKNPSAEKMVNFYKQLNSMGKWTSRKEKNLLITEVKNGIKDTFKAQGKEGEEFLKTFEKVNKGIEKAYDAEELVELIGKSRSPDGSNYKKLHKALEDPENYQLMEDVLGKTQAQNVKLISKTGSDIKNFDQAWTRGSKGFTAKAGNAGIWYNVWKHLSDFSPVKAGLALTVGIGKASGEKLLEKSLRDPKFQNLVIKGLHALKNESPKAFNSINEQIIKELESDSED